MTCGFTMVFSPFRRRLRAGVGPQFPDGKQPLLPHIIVLCCCTFVVDRSYIGGEE